MQPQAEIDFAKHFVSLFARHDFGEIRKELDASVDWTSAAPAIERMANMVPAGKFNSVDVGWTTTGSLTSQAGASSVIQIVLFYHYSKGNDLRAVVVIRTMQGSFRVTSVSFTPLSHTLIDENAFSLWGKPFTNYVALFFAVIIVLLIVDALIQLARNPSVNRRWLWAIFVLFGFLQINVNWTTGAIGLNFFTFQFFGAGMTKATVYSPWILSLSIPIGAIIFLVRQPKLVGAKDGNDLRSD